MRMPAAAARSEPIVKLFVFNKIAQCARDRWSHLCARGYTLAGVVRDEFVFSETLAASRCRCAIDRLGWYNIELPSRVTAEVAAESHAGGQPRNRLELPRGEAEHLDRRLRLRGAVHHEDAVLRDVEIERPAPADDLNFLASFGRDRPDALDRWLLRVVDALGRPTRRPGPGRRQRSPDSAVPPDDGIFQIWSSPVRSDAK